MSVGLACLNIFADAHYYYLATVLGASATGNDATMGRGDAENARHEYSAKAEYRKALVVKYR